MFELPLQRLLALQSGNGAFASEIETASGVIADQNCFSTAQIALVLGDLRLRIGDPDRHLAKAHSRALDFVESCADRRILGSFGFYPNTEEGAAPSPLGVRLNPDIDDTALAWMALVRGKRRSAEQLRKSLPPLIAGSTVRVARRGDPPGTCAPLLRTWMSPPGTGDLDPNPVDLIANLNMAACLTLAGLPASPAWLHRLTLWSERCDGSRSSMRSISPYYLEAVELEIALRRAVQSGCSALAPALTRLRQLGMDEHDQWQRRPERRALYCNAHGNPRWYCPALQQARFCADLSQPPARRLRLPSLLTRETHVIHA